VSPRQKIGNEKTPEQIAKARWRATHPAGAVDTWESHPSGCACMQCAYVDHWLDRDDDIMDEAEA
jgi:hypothetical protein